MKQIGVRGRYGPAIVWGVAILLVVIGFVGSNLSSDTGRFSPRDYGPHGIAAVASLWERLGYDVQIVSSEDVRPLNSHTYSPDDKPWVSGTLVFVDTPQLRAYRRSLRWWIQEGNTAMILGRANEGFQVYPDSWLGLQWGYVAPGFQGASGVPREWVTSDDTSWDDLRLRRPVRGVAVATNIAEELRDVPTALTGPDPLYLEQHAAAVQAGEGWIVAIADARTLSNRDVHHEGHAALAVQLTQYFVPDQPVYMVDITPRTQSPSILVGGRLPVSPETMGYVFLIGCVVLWRVGRRFGAPLTLNETSQRRLIEQVLSVAQLYERGGAHRRALRAVYEEATDQVARQLGRRPHQDLDWERAERLMGSRGDREHPASWSDLATRTEAILAGKKASAGDVVALARQWERVRRAGGGRVLPPRAIVAADRRNEVEE